MNILIPPKPELVNNLNLRILFSLIPPKANNFTLLASDKKLNLCMSKKLFDFSMKKIGERNIAPLIISNEVLYILTEKSRILGFN